MCRARTLALALILVLQASLAGAQTTVAVLGVEAVDAPLNMANLLSSALQNQVRQTSGFKLVAGKDLEEIKLVFGCVDEKPQCMAKAGRNLSAAKLTWGSLKKTASGYNLTIKWLDVEKGRVERFVNENIGRTELNQAQATQVIQRLTRSFLISNYGMIKISTNVAGAQVLLGARAVGITDKDPLLLRDVAAGTHLVRITRDGYRPWTQQVMVQGGETTEVDAELVADGESGTTIPPTPPTTRSTRAGWKIAFWSGAAVTVGLAVGFGITGYSVLNAEKEKDNAIGDFRGLKTCKDDPTCDGQAFSSDDACNEIGTYDKFGDTGSIKSACDKGDNMATVTNALIGATLGVAAISAYLYYKAYISKASVEQEKPADADSEEESVSRPSPPAWMVTPSVGPGGAGFGFEMRF